MDPNAVVLDISSDEEVDPNNACDPVGGVDKDFIGELDWLKEFLYDNDVIEERTDDSDDVVLVGEVLNNPKQNLKPLVGEAADDDCVVLEGDPYKLVSIQNDTTSDSDDVLVVGQKGQVARRDFPHSRHLCANFPFTSTPHERHCNQCTAMFVTHLLHVSNGELEFPILTIAMPLKKMNSGQFRGKV